MHVLYYQISHGFGIYGLYKVMQDFYPSSTIGRGGIDSWRRAGSCSCISRCSSASQMQRITSHPNGPSTLLVNVYHIYVHIHIHICVYTYAPKSEQSSSCNSEYNSSCTLRSRYTQCNMYHLDHRACRLRKAGSLGGWVGGLKKAPPAVQCL